MERNAIVKTVKTIQIYKTQLLAGPCGAAMTVFAWWTIWLVTSTSHSGIFMRLLNSATRASRVIASNRFKLKVTLLLPWWLV